MLKYILSFFLVINAACLAADSKPTDTSVRQWLAIIDAKKKFGTLAAETWAKQMSAAREAMLSKPVPPRVRAIVERSNIKTTELIKAELNWPEVELILVRAYQENYTHEEIADLIGHYKSLTQQKITEKSPKIAEYVVAELQQRFGEISARGLHAALVEIKAENEKQTKP